MAKTVDGINREGVDTSSFSQSSVVATDSLNELITVTPWAEGQVLAMLGGKPTWAASSAVPGTGTVASVTASLPLASTGGNNPNITLASTLGTGLVLLASTGTDGQVLTLALGIPTWLTPAIPVTSVTASSPLASTGGATPNISITSSTGTGAIVLANTPTLITPVLGAATGTSLQLSSLTASRLLLTDALKNLVSLATGTDGQVLTLASGTPAWSTPTTGTVTLVSATLPLASSGGATPTISISSSTGSGAVVLQTSPTLTTPNIGAATGSSLTLSQSSSSILTVNNSNINFGSEAKLFIQNGPNQSVQIRMTNGNSTDNYYVLALTCQNSTYTNAHVVLNRSGAITHFLEGSVNIPSLTASRLVYSDGGKTLVTLATGTDGQVLTLASGTPVWSTPTTGTVTSVTASSPLASSGGAAPNISITSSTGTGAIVLANTPTLITPVLGAATGTSLQLSSLTASRLLLTDASKNLVSLATGTDGQVLTLASGTPAWSTPTTGTVTSITASSPLASSGGATPNISITSSTGSGAVVLANTPTLITPALGSATGTSLVLVNQLQASYFQISAAASIASTITNTTNSTSSYAIFQLLNNTASPCSLFLNSTLRTADGGSNGATLRNDGGPMTIANNASSLVMSGSTTTLTASSLGSSTAGILNISNTDASGRCMQTALTPTLAAGSSTFTLLGREASTNNSAGLFFNYNTLGSGTNTIGLSLYNASQVTIDGGANMTIPGSLTVTGLTYNIPSVQRFDFNGGSSPWPNDPGFTFFTPVKNWVERESTTSFKLSYVQNHPVRVVNTIDAAFVNSLGRTVVVQVTFSGRRDGGIGGSRFGIFKGVDGATTSDNYYDIPLAYSVVTATDSSAISATAILAPGNWIMLGVTQNSGAGYNCIDGLAQFVVSG